MLKASFYIFNGNDSDRENVESAFSLLNFYAVTNSGVASVVNNFTDVPIYFDEDRFKEGGTAVFVRNDYSPSFIAVNPGHTSGSRTDTAGNTERYADRSFARTLFHELFHAATLISSEDVSSFMLPQNPDINLNEAAAIFAENLLFAPVAGEHFRMGHVNWNVSEEGSSGTPRNSSDVAKATGMNAFSWITSTRGPTFVNTSSGPSFSLYSDDGMLGVTKTYLKSGIGLGHYIELIGQNNSGFLSITKEKTVYGDGIRPIVESMMGGGISGFETAASIIRSLYSDHSYLNLYDFNIYRIMGGWRRQLL